MRGGARTIRAPTCIHLVKAGEILGMMLPTAINLGYYQDLMRDMRDAIAARRFEDFRARTIAAWQGNDG